MEITDKMLTEYIFSISNILIVYLEMGAEIIGKKNIFFVNDEKKYSRRNKTDVAASERYLGHEFFGGRKRST